MYIGIDLGGTNISAGIVTGSGDLLHKKSIPTNSNKCADELIKEMADLALVLIAEYGIGLNDVHSIGIGCPGSVNINTGVVVFAPNIPMHNVPTADIFRKHINLPVSIENDANAAAYGEYIKNGNNSNSYIFVTLGTGIGGGIILNGCIYRGFNGVGAELGHMTLTHNGIKCNCGKNGCWEKYASVTALIEQTKMAIKENPKSIMNEAKIISGRTAFDAAKAGDGTAQTVIDEYCRYVGDGIVSLVNIFQPEYIVLGGGISKEGEYLLNPIRRFAEQNDFNKYAARTTLKVAELFNDAGIVGAALVGKGKCDFA